MRRHFTTSIYFVFLDIRKPIFDIKKSIRTISCYKKHIFLYRKKFLNIKNVFMDTKKIDPNSLLLKIVFFLYKKYRFLDIKNSVFLYQEMGSIFFYIENSIFYIKNRVFDKKKYRILKK